jgi:hypothetical protein
MRYLDALHRLIDKSNLNEDERREVKDAFTLEHGSDAEKEVVKQGSPEAQRQAAFQAAVDKRAAELVAEKQKQADAAAQQAQVEAAAAAQAGQ